MTVQRVVTPTDLSADFDLGTLIPDKISIVPATTTTTGKVRIATAADIVAGTTGAAGAAGKASAA